MTQINLYLGAHKTATTHLQGLLVANRERLLARQVALSAPEDVRKDWLPKFLKYCNGNNAGNPGKGRPIVRELRALLPEQKLWILTEENIAGVPNNLALRPGIYPFAGKRIQALGQLFKNASMTLFFSLRSYDSFYRSAYSEVVRNRGYIPFQEFYDEARFAKNSWVDTVRGFHEALPQENIVLWQYEHFRTLVPQLVRLLTGLEEVDELISAYAPETTRPSLSQKTMDILGDLHPVLTREESKQLVERINQAYPVDEVHAAAKPFTAEQEAAFRRRYEDDIAEIKASFPRIRFLQP